MVEEKPERERGGGTSILEYSPKNSCRERSTHLFRAFLYTQCAISKTEHEPQGGEEANAELDV